MSDFRPAPLVRVVDDDPTVCQSMQFVLEIAGFQVKPYLSAAAFLEGDDASRAGCVILDVRMPGMTGIELQREMAARGIDLPVIFLSAHGDIEMAVQAVHDGARTFLVKPPQLGKLLAAIEGAVEHHSALRRRKAEAQALGRLWAGLTPAEQQVAKMVAKGLTNAVVAEALGVSERTVRGQRAAVYAKLDVENAAELSLFWRDLEEAGGRLP
ncbi:MAG: response regulator transcription factor [Duodenibacillus sp.]|nr:response regulator transcription factor [Duodenibacillus sp.]